MLIAFAFSLAASLPFAAEQPIVEPADRPVALAGTLSVEHAYGPPGYGEDKRTDARVSYWALKLTFEMTTECTAQTPDLWSIQCSPTHLLRLFFPLNPEGNELIEKARSLRGRKVLATGVLHRRSAVAETTPVYMDVADISEIKHGKVPLVQGFHL
jgi:hypothetical protein